MTVRIVEDVPIAGRDVVFQASDGSVVTHAQTGADGVATAEVSPGGMVTVVRMVGSAATAVTVTGVQPGDVLEMGTRYTKDVNLGQVSVTGPGAFAGAVVYVVQIPGATVFTGSLSWVLDVTPSRLDAAGHLQLLAVAHDRALVPLAFSFVRDLDFGSPSTAVAMPAWRTDWQEVAVELGNPPEAAAGASASLSLRPGTSIVSGDDESGAWTSGTLSLPLRIPRGFADSVSYDVEVTSVPGRPSESSRQSLFGSWPATAVPATLRVDATADLLPRVHTPVLDASDPARPKVTWSATGDISGATAVRVDIGWGNSNAWAIVAPAGAPLPLTVPALPDALAAFRPPAGAASRLEVFAIDAPSVGGYEGYRQGFADTPVLAVARKVPAARTTGSMQRR